MSDRQRMIEELKKALAQVESWSNVEFREKQYGDSVMDEHDLLQLNYNFADDQRGRRDE